MKKNKKKTFSTFWRKKTPVFPKYYKNGQKFPANSQNSALPSYAFQYIDAFKPKCLNLLTGVSLSEENMSVLFQHLWTNRIKFTLISLVPSDSGNFRLLIGVWYLCGRAASTIPVQYCHCTWRSRSKLCSYTLSPSNISWWKRNSSINSNIEKNLCPVHNFMSRDIWHHLMFYI